MTVASSRPLLLQRADSPIGPLLLKKANATQTNGSVLLGERRQESHATSRFCKQPTLVESWQKFKWINGKVAADFSTWKMREFNIVNGGLRDRCGTCRHCSKWNGLVNISDETLNFKLKQNIDLAARLGEFLEPRPKITSATLASICFIVCKSSQPFEIGKSCRFGVVGIFSGSLIVTVKQAALCKWCRRKVEAGPCGNSFPRAN